MVNSLKTGISISHCFDIGKDLLLTWDELWHSRSLVQIYDADLNWLECFEIDFPNVDDAVCLKKDHVLIRSGNSVIEYGFDGTKHVSLPFSHIIKVYPEIQSERFINQYLVPGTKDLFLGGRYVKMEEDPVEPTIVPWGAEARATATLLLKQNRGLVVGTDDGQVHFLQLMRGVNPAS